MSFPRHQLHLTLVAIHPYPSPQAVPLANAMLQSYLSTRPELAKKLDIAREDFFTGQDTTSCIEQLAAARPEAVGFSIYAWNREMCLEIAKGLSGRLHGVVIFAGGPEATADIAGVLTAAPFDFVVAGEGELPFVAACERLVAKAGFSGIPGIAMRGAQVKEMMLAMVLPELDSIPSPWLSGNLDARKYPGILWQLSRGCGFGCDFCFDSRGSHGVRRFSMTRIEAELRHFAECGVGQVFVLDSTFNHDPARAKSILRLIAAIAPQIHFHFEVRSEFIDREMAQLFAGITCSLQIGLQSADPRVMQQVGRKFDRKQFAAKAGLLNESGAVFGFDLMYGLPGDTLSGFRESIDFAIGLYPNHLDIFPLAILPGTALAGRSSAIGLRHQTAPPYTLISSPTFSAEDLAAAKTLAAACDIFYTRGKAVAWFNSVVKALGQRPSQFLEQFGHWLQQRGAAEEAKLDDHQVWQLQRRFLEAAFGTKKQKGMQLLALDLADYHHYYAVVLLTPPSAVHALPPKPCEAAWRLAPSARLARFNYEILDILEAGEPDLRSFSREFQACSSLAVIYSHPEGIFTESLIKPYYRLLELCDGRTPWRQLAARLKVPQDEALSFLEFAVAEGILVRT